MPYFKVPAIIPGQIKLNLARPLFNPGKPLKKQAQGWHPDRNDGILQKCKLGAGLIRTSPIPLKTKIRGIVPNRPKADCPDSGAKKSRAPPAGDKIFVGQHWKDIRFTLKRNREAKEAELVI